VLSGFGAVLEAGKFLEHAGLQPAYIKFSDVNGPTKALLTQDRHRLRGAGKRRFHARNPACAGRDRAGDADRRKPSAKATAAVAGEMLRGVGKHPVRDHPARCRVALTCRYAERCDI
jgi:hypothetical protein